MEDLDLQVDPPIWLERRDGSWKAVAPAPTSSSARRPLADASCTTRPVAFATRMRSAWKRCALAAPAGAQPASAATRTATAPGPARCGARVLMAQR